MAKRKRPRWFDDYVPEEVSSSSLFKFDIIINKKKMTVDMRADLDIDYNIIQQQLEDTPSEFAYWAAIFSELRMQVSMVERSIKAHRGRLIDRAIKDASEAGVRLTDKQVLSMIEADSDLNRLEAKLLLLNKHCGKMYFMVDAMRMKSDNLRSLAGFARIEMSNP